MPLIVNCWSRETKPGLRTCSVLVLAGFRSCSDIRYDRWHLADVDQRSSADGKLEHEPAFWIVRGVAGELGDPFEAIADGAGAEV